LTGFKKLSRLECFWISRVGGFEEHGIDLPAPHTTELKRLTGSLLDEGLMSQGKPAQVTEPLHGRLRIVRGPANCEDPGISDRL
jgi:hypothetical protein